MSQFQLFPTSTVGPTVPTSFVEDVGTAIPALNTLHINGTAAQGITTSGAGSTVTITASNAAAAQKGVVALATSTEVKTGTDASKVITPSTLNSLMSDSVLTGFVSWGGAGAYFDDATLGTFKLLRPGTGYIKSKLVSWVAQNFVGMTAGNTYYIYIDSTGTIGATATRTDALFENNIVLFECLRDSTPVTNNQVTVRENHPYSYSTTVSNYEHDNIGTLIENNTNGANITLNGTQRIQINGADVLSDHGLETTIPDSGGSGVTWQKKYTTAAGKWALQNSTTTFTGFWNNAGTPTALTANRFAVYTLYVSKDNLNASTPVYFAVLDTAQYGSQAAATTAISNGTTAKATNELAQLELCQLGYIIYRESTSSITSVIISKSTLRQTLSTAGSNAASLINTNTAAFNGWLSASDTNVQAALDTLDDSQRCTIVTGASANLVSKQGVIANRGTLVTLTLPTTTAVGDTIEVVGMGVGGWQIAQNVNQLLHMGVLTSSTGVTGYLASTAQYDCVKLICSVANLEYVVTSSFGNITVA